MTARLHSLRHQEKKSSAGGSASQRQAQHHHHSQQQGPSHQGPSPAPSPSPSPSPSLSPSPKHSDGRRANKPLMEKRRRARINQSLAALKALILDSARLENTKHSKLEKADILELTVRHLQRQRSLAQPGLSRYKAGYQDCSREVSRYLDAPDIITGNTTPMDPAVKQRLLRHLDSCVSELDLDLGSRPDSGLGSSPGSVTDRIAGTSSPGPLEHHVGPSISHCSTSLNPVALIKSEIPDMESARPDSSTTAGDENNNSSRPTSAFGQANPSIIDAHHAAAAAAAAAAGLPVDQASTSQQNPNMLSVVQVIPSRLPDGQVVFLLPSHYVQLAAAAAANGISIGPNPPTTIWAATNMSLLKATDKLVKRPHEEVEDWQEAAAAAAAAAAGGGSVLKSSKLLRMEHPEQPLDFTTSSKKMKTSPSRSERSGSVHGFPPSEHLQHQQQQLQQSQQQSLLRLSSGDSSAGADERPSSRGPLEIPAEMRSPSPTPMSATAIQPSQSPAVSSPLGQQPVKDEDGMWRPW